MGVGDWDSQVLALKLGEARESGFLASRRSADLDPEVPAEFISQALASFKLQQEQGFQEQSALAAEARETRRQEMLERIAEGQAAKKQKLEPDSGASEFQEASAGENEATVSQASREYDEAGEGGSGVQGPR